MIKLVAGQETVVPKDEVVHIFFSGRFREVSLKDYVTHGLKALPSARVTDDNHRHLVCLGGRYVLLSRQQQAVYEGLMAGRQNKEIALAMGPEATVPMVKFHLTHIYKLFGVTCCRELLGMAIADLTARAG